MRFQNRIALVTGCGQLQGATTQSIGHAVAAKLLAEDAKVVYAVDIDKGGLDRACDAIEAGGVQSDRLVRVVADITDHGFLGSVFDRVIDEAGQLDVVVNCGGVSGPNGPQKGHLLAIDPKMFEHVLCVNTFGTFNVTQHAVRVMKPKNFGRICNVASIAGKEGNPYMAHYNASKGGVVIFTRGVGKELALAHAADSSHDITCNCFCPSTIMTPMVERDCDAAMIAIMKGKILMGRLMTVEEAAYRIAGIVDPDPLNGSVNGFAYDMTGGRAVS